MTEIPKGLVLEPRFHTIGAVSILLGVATILYGVSTESDAVAKFGLVPTLFGALAMYLRKKVDLYPGEGQE